ncbi:MAG: ABC transporter substrate-binding protein [Betaproteobacteria bacterium]|nr:ABC transporter substrate-binding protein [Betaproteobacteria bacterium]
MNRPECVEAANPSRRRALATVAAGAAALAAAPLRAQAPDKVQLQLNWFHLADHSPIYLALKKGYFKEEGIDLTVLRGSGSADSAKKIDLGQADVGISDAPTVLTAISKGANLRMVAVVYDKAGNNVFFRKGANIRSPKDLVGKKIAVPPADSHRVLWPAFAAMHGIAPDAVTLVNVKPEGKQAIVAANEVDASFDLYTSYAIWEKVLGKGDVGHLLWADFGLPIYGHTYFVNNELIKKNPKLIERFLRATHKGWRDAKASPAASIDAMVEAVPGLDRNTLLATMPQILDLCVTERSAKHGLGWIEPELMQKTMDITFASNKPERPFAVADAFTNQFSSRIKP